MSYASKIKTDIAAQLSGGRSRQMAELSALVRACGTLTIRSKGKLDLSLSTENKAVSEIIKTLFEKLFDIKGRLISIEKKSLNKHVIYQIVVSDVKDVLSQLGLIDTTNLFNIIDDVPSFVFADNANSRAYIRGMFLGAGSISDPEKSYHLEFVINSEKFAMRFVELLKAFDIFAKILERKHHYIIYLKDSNQIVDVLNIIGAHRYLLSYESTRVNKAMRNKVNRIVNCDTANVKKMMAAANKHILAIDKIKQKRGLETLPESLKEIANLRLANPEMTLLELGQLLKPPISKSGVNHRMKKIMKIADSLENNNKNLPNADN